MYYNQNIFFFGMKAIIILLLVVFLFISIAGFSQTRLINSAIKTKISGLINFVSLLRLVSIVIAIFIVLLV